MSTEITKAFVEQYSSNIQMLSQAKGSALRDKVRLESVTGKNAFFDQIGSVTATVRSSRHSNTPQADTPHSRRRVSLVDYEFADLVDDLDKVRMLVDPTSSYAQAAAYAMGRAMDDAIIAAAIKLSIILLITSDTPRRTLRYPAIAAHRPPAIIATTTISNTCSTGGRLTAAPTTAPKNAPMRYWPSIPILKSNILNPIAAATPAK